MINVAGLVGAIPTISVTLRTFNASTINAYGESAATYTDTTRSMVVHPAPTRMLERLPDSDRHRETIAVYDTAAVRTVGTVRPNQIYYQSRWYEVVESGDYLTLGGIVITLAQLVEDDGT